MQYKLIGIRYYENEKGKGTVLFYLQELHGDAKGYEGKMKMIYNKHLKDLAPGNEFEFIFDLDYKGNPIVVDAKKIEK